jgi:glyoxylase-like metal-dependent hydrolase (beta-lactamase superfamily II)
MRLTTIFLTTLISAGALGCDGDQGPAGPAGPAGPTGPAGGLDPSAPAIDKAFTGLGGRDAVAALASFRFQATGERLLTLEGFAPDDDSQLTSTFTADVTADVAGDRLRIAYQRKLLFFGPTTNYRVIVKGNVGVVDGVESAFGAPGGPMPSDRWAATVQQHRLLNPQLLLRDVALGKATATDAGLALRDGELRHQIDITNDVRPISLFIDRTTGEITDLATFQNDFVTGDVKLEAHYANWQSSDGKVRFPADVVLAVNDQIWHSEHRASVTTKVALDDAQFAFPAGAVPTYVAADAARGARTGEFHEAFAGIGVPLDGLQTTIDAQSLATGVWHLRGGTHNSLVVEQAAGVVIVDAPLDEARAQAIFDWLAINIPNKPVTHVVLTHHHRDHVGSLRTFVARGAKVVVGEAARPFFSRTLRAAHTVEPDELTAAPHTPTFVTVPAGGEITLADATRPVRVLAVDSTHAADMVVAYTPNQRVLFVSDLFSPGLPPNPPAAREVRNTVQARGLAIAAIAGGHGGVGTRADLDAAAGP